MGKLSDPLAFVAFAVVFVVGVLFSPILHDTYGRLTSELKREFLLIIADSNPSCEVGRSELQSAALAVLYPVLGSNDSEFTGRVGLATERQLDAKQGKIDELRQWTDSLPNDCVRKMYIEWLDHYQQGVERARQGILKEEKIHGLVDTLPRPPR